MDSQTQAQLDEALLKAATLGSTTEIHSLLDRHANINNTLDNHGRTPLHVASSYGHHQCIELLLDRHANINALTNNHQTPLHLASWNGHHQCIELLLDRHADINALDNDSYTPLHHASSYGHHQCIELLLDRHADINALALDNDTPLHVASLNGHHQCIEVLIDHCADKLFIDVRDCELSISISREILHLPFAALTLCLSLSMIRRPSGFRYNSRAPRQDARDCSIDSRSRCVTHTLVDAFLLSLCLSLSLGRHRFNHRTTRCCSWSFACLLMMMMIWLLLLRSID